MVSCGTGEHGKSSVAANVLQGCAQFFLPGVFSDGRSGRVELLPGWEEMSGKFALVANMLAVLYAETDDRVVIVSNYTQVLILRFSDSVVVVVWCCCACDDTFQRCASRCVWWRHCPSNYIANPTAIVLSARAGPALHAFLLRRRWTCSCNSASSAAIRMCAWTAASARTSARNLSRHSIMRRQVVLEQVWIVEVLQYVCSSIGTVSVG